jgi:hypothetical protein
MANQNTVGGFENYPLPLSLYTAGSENVLFAPTASGVYTSLPSPLFPLSTSANPVALYAAPSPDISGSVYDGHPFEIKLAIKFTTTGTCSIKVNLYQVTNAVLTSGLTSTTYATLTQASPSGTGINELIAGTSTAANTTSGTIIYSGQYIWDSVGKILGIANVGTTFQKGVSITTTQQSSGAVTVSNFTDLNFIPSFTFATNLPSVFTITEFSINRV